MEKSYRGFTVKVEHFHSEYRYSVKRNSDGLVLWDGLTGRNSSIREIYEHVFSRLDILIHREQLELRDAIRKIEDQKERRKRLRKVWNILNTTTDTN